jgi:hypothetical protein
MHLTCNKFNVHGVAHMKHFPSMSPLYQRNNHCQIGPPTEGPWTLYVSFLGLKLIPKYAHQKGATSNIDRYWWCCIWGQGTHRIQTSHLQNLICLFFIGFLKNVETWNEGRIWGQIIFWLEFQTNLWMKVGDLSVVLKVKFQSWTLN